MPQRDNTSMSVGPEWSKARRGIRGIGQGIGALDEILFENEVVARLRRAYHAARDALCANVW